MTLRLASSRLELYYPTISRSPSITLSLTEFWDSITRGGDSEIDLRHPQGTIRACLVCSHYEAWKNNDHNKHFPVSECRLMGGGEQREQ